MNAFGPRLAGSVAVYLALPAVLVLLGLSGAGLFSGQERIVQAPMQGLGKDGQFYGNGAGFVGSRSRGEHDRGDEGRSR